MSASPSLSSKHTIPTSDPRKLRLFLLLTKADTLGLSRFLRWKWWKRGLLYNVCVDIFNRFFLDYIQDRQGRIKCTVLPVSAYGQSSVRTANNFSIRPGTTRIKSFQIHIPMLYAFKTIMEQLRPDTRMAQKTAILAYEAARREFQNLPWWRRFGPSPTPQRDALQHYKARIRDLHRLQASLEAGINEIIKVTPTVSYELGATRSSPPPAAPEAPQRKKADKDHSRKFLFTADERNDYAMRQGKELPKLVHASLSRLQRYRTWLVDGVGFYSFAVDDLWLSATIERTDRKDAFGRNIYETRGAVWPIEKVADNWHTFAVAPKSRSSRVPRGV